MEGEGTGRGEGEREEGGEEERTKEGRKGERSGKGEREGEELTNFEGYSYIVICVSSAYDLIRNSPSWSDCTNNRQEIAAYLALQSQQVVCN